jgi:hypothetical protein
MNPPPVEASVDDFQLKKLSFIWMQWFRRLFTFIQGVTDYTATSIQAPITGFLVIIPDRIFVLTLNPAGTLATGTIKTPANPLDGQPLEVASTQTITSLTFSPSGTQTVKNAPTTLVAGTGFAYYYNLKTTTWYRRY